jgi:uncharacterized protein with PQ loop repeat
MNKINQKEKTLMKTFAEICGWLGAGLIHFATIPTTLGVILGQNPSLPELSLVVLVWSGLMLYLVRAIAQKDWLYIVSNALGFFLNSILLIIILL